MNTSQKAASSDLIDQLLSDYQKPEDLIGEHGLLKHLTKAIVERALQAEMNAHLVHSKNANVTNPVANTRNGKSSKTLKGNGVRHTIPRTSQNNYIEGARGAAWNIVSNR